MKIRIPEKANLGKMGKNTYTNLNSQKFKKVGYEIIFLWLIKFILSSKQYNCHNLDELYGLDRQTKIKVIRFGEK